jgi:S1-C subfamily serine protease
LPGAPNRLCEHAFVERIRLIATALLLPLAACGHDAPARLTVVAIAATPCDRPTARLGVGAVVDDGLVLTAAHVVEDELREVTVDGRPARVVALDARTDAAVLALDTPIRRGAATMSDAAVAEAVQIVTPARVIETTVERIVTLSVDDTTDGVVHVRPALVLDGGMPGGVSGAPVVDRDGRIVAMVTVTHAGRDVTYATTTEALRTLIDSAIDLGIPSGIDSVTRPSLAAPEPCA